MRDCRESNVFHHNNPRHASSLFYRGKLILQQHLTNLFGLYSVYASDYALVISSFLLLISLHRLVSTITFRVCYNFICVSSLIFITAVILVGNYACNDKPQLPAAANVSTNKDEVQHATGRQADYHSVRATTIAITPATGKITTTAAAATTAVKTEVAATTAAATVTHSFQCDSYGPNYYRHS